MGANPVKGIITFALEGVFLVFSFGFVSLFFSGETANMSHAISGLFLAVIGFLFVGVGLWGIIQDAVASRRQNENPGGT